MTSKRHSLVKSASFGDTARLASSSGRYAFARSAGTRSFDGIQRVARVLKGFAVCMALALTLLATQSGWAAPHVTVGPLTPIEAEPTPLPNWAHFKSAAFDGSRWLVVYTTHMNTMAGVWLGTDGAALGNSFPLFDDAQGVDPRLVFDGQSFVLSWNRQDDTSHEVRRIGRDSVGPSIVELSPSGRDSGILLAQDAAVDSSGIVQTVACWLGSGTSDCTISTLSGDALDPDTTFSLPYPVESLEFEPDQNGFFIFAESELEAVTAYHVGHDGVLSDPIPLSAPRAFSDFLPTLSVARTADAYALSWGREGAVHLAQLDLTGQVLANFIVPDARLRASLIATSEGYALATLSETQAGALSVRTLDSNLQPNAGPSQLNTCHDEDFTLALGGEHLLGAWGCDALRVSVLDARSLTVVSPPPVDLSFTAAQHVQVLAAPSGDKWLIVAADYQGEVRGWQFERDGTPRGDSRVLAGSTDQPVALGELSGGREGWLMTWSEGGAGLPLDQRAMLVYRDGSTGAPFQLDGQPAVTKTEDGWLLLQVVEGGRVLVADRYASDASLVSRVELGRSTSDRVSYEAAEVAANERGFLMLWQVATRGGDALVFHDLYSMQLDHGGAPLEAPEHLLPPEETERLSLATAGDASWLAIGTSSMNYFSPLPLAEPLQELGERAFVRARAVAGHAAVAWTKPYTLPRLSLLGLAEPGGTLAERGQVAMELTAFSEPLQKQLMLAGVVETRILGGNVKRGMFSIVEIEADGDGGAGGAEGSGQGCGCRVAGGPGAGFWAPLALATLALSRRRVRRNPPTLLAPRRPSHP